MVEITQELLAKLEFQPKKQDADMEEIFQPGNVLRLFSHEELQKKPGLGRYKKYILVGHVNASGGGCECCGYGLEWIEAVAHISQLFKED